MTPLDWMLDGDPSIRWQALRDLADAPAEVVAAERARVATEGWGARLLALQGDDGQWDGGALFPGGWWDRPAGGRPTEHEGQPWTATEPTLALLRAFGVDPTDERVRRAVEQVRDHCRWEHEGQAFFDGEVEPCINGRTVALGVYFGQDVEGIVARLVGEQLEDGGWNCEAEFGSVRSSFDTTINVLEGLLAYERATGGSAGSPRRDAGARSTCSNGSCSGARARARSLVRPGCSSRSRPAGTTTCCVRSSTSERPAIRRTRGWTRRSSCSDPSSSPTGRGCSRTRIPARSTSRSRTAMAGPAGGTRSGRCVCFAGTSDQVAERPFRGFGVAARAPRASGRARTRTRTDRRTPSRRPTRRRG